RSPGGTATARPRSGCPSRARSTRRAARARPRARRLGRRRAEIATDQHRSRGRAARCAGPRAPRLPLLGEAREIIGAGEERAPALLGLLLVLPRLYPPRQPLAALVDADTRRLVSADLDAAKAGVVERLGGHDDERRGIAVGRQRDLALFPELRQVVAPRLLQAGEEEIGPAEQQHFRERRVALGERREV